MSVVRWSFTDPITSATYSFNMNPNAGGSPQYKKKILTQNTTAPGGNVLLFEGADEPRTGTVSGTILELSHYQAIVDWWEKRYPVVMTDDLGRTQTIYITEFLPERVRAANHPYKHTFTMNYAVISTNDL